MMDNQQISNTNDVQEDTTPVYLVTEAIETEKIAPQQLQNDLDFLKKSEVRAAYQPDLTKKIENPSLSRAMQALRLINPFKGY